MNLAQLKLRNWSRREAIMRGSLLEDLGTFCSHKYLPVKRQQQRVLYNTLMSVTRSKTPYIENTMKHAIITKQNQS